MEITNNTYLKFIDFIDVSNWSVQYLKWTAFSYNKNFEFVKIWDFLTRNKTQIDIEDWKEYKRVTIKMNNNWVFLRDIEKWENIWTKKQFLVSWWEFIMSKIDARNWAFWIVPNELKWAIVTNDFPSFIVDKSKINIEFLILILWTKEFLDYAQQWSSWTTWRQRVDMNVFLNTKIPLPSLEEQNRIVEEYNKKLENSLNTEIKAWELEKEIESYLMEELGIEIKENKNWNKGLQIVEFKDLDKWNIWNEQVIVKSNKYGTIKIWDSIRGINSKIDKVQTKDYLENWKTPIVSQENNLISWYTNKNLTTINWDDLPLIVFWDHSKTVKYIDFEFVCWADWVRLMKPILDFNSEFYYYYISLVVNFINPIESYTRHWKYLSQINIPLPPLEIQEQIVKHIWKIKEEIRSLKKLSLDLKESAKVEFERGIFS